MLLARAAANLEDKTCTELTGASRQIGPIISGLHLETQCTCQLNQFQSITKKMYNCKGHMHTPSALGFSKFMTWYYEHHLTMDEDYLDHLCLNFDAEQYILDSIQYVKESHINSAQKKRRVEALEECMMDFHTVIKNRTDCFIKGEIVEKHGAIARSICARITILRDLSANINKAVSH